MDFGTPVEFGMAKFWFSSLGLMLGFVAVITHSLDGIINQQIANPTKRGTFTPQGWLCLAIKGKNSKILRLKN